MGSTILSDFFGKLYIIVLFVNVFVTVLDVVLMQCCKYLERMEPEKNVFFRALHYNFFLLLFPR